MPLITAIVENGVLRPLSPINLPEKSRVRIDVQAEGAIAPGHPPVGTLEEIRSIIDTHQEELLNCFGVGSLSVFGSFARGEQEEGSDVDMLVDFAASPTLDSYMGLKERLEELLGRHVDLVTRRSMRNEFRSRMAEEAIRVA